jgi:hypothetical protein
MLKTIYSLIFLFSFVSNVSSQVACNNWLLTNTNSSYASLGDLDVSGNQLTVEALVCRTSDNSASTSGHVISKHNNSNNANYNLSIYGSEITTSVSGYTQAFEICPSRLNKTYHIAMVYDGVNLKFYRDGFLHTSTPCTGNLVNNNLIARISQIADAGTATYPNTQFIGFINEVRIWNVARTSNEINQYKFSTLPSPTTQIGLLAYYSFNNLGNKQGNLSYNANLFGSATINSNNTSCTYVSDSCCSKSFYANSIGDFATIGDADVIGNKLTVEAVARHIGSLSGQPSGHIVSKHTNSTNINYNLSIYGAEITTSVTGYVQAFANCPTEINKTYHVAMVYDGASLKFYRNGVLLANTPCTGNLINNDLTARIAQISDVGSNFPSNTQYFGYVDEVKIWNVARSKEDIKEYINKPLVDPISQQGLIAYYNFNDLINKQGNTAYNLTLLNAATINTFNPNCNVILDSCGQVLPFNYKNFSVNREKNNLFQISFSTLNDNYCSNFYVEKSNNGIDYQVVKNIFSSKKEGLTNYNTDYTERDNLGLIYFRICFVKNDGRKVYSNVIKINLVENINNVVSIFPNPTTQNNISFSINYNKSENLKVQLTTITGQAIAVNYFNLKKGINSLKIMPSIEIPDGIYLINFVIDNRRITKKVVIKKGAL